MARQHSTKEFIVGAAVGSLLGGVTALLMAPASGETIRNGINQLKDDINDPQAFIKTLKGICAAKEEIEECGTRDLLIGSAIGVLLGATAGLLLAPKPGAEMREDITETYNDLSEKTHAFAKKGKAFAKTAKNQTNKWVSLAHDVIDGFIDETEEKGEEFLDGAKSRLDDAMEWATIGYRIWQGLSKKRR